MKLLKPALLLSIVILFSGCYTQLKYQQSAEKKSSSDQTYGYDWYQNGDDRNVEDEGTTVRTEKQADQRYKEPRSSKMGFYYNGRDHYYDSYYYDDVRFHNTYNAYGYHPYDYRRNWGGSFGYHYRPYSKTWFSFSIGFGKYRPFYSWHDYYRWHGHYGWHDYYALYPWRYGYGHGYGGNHYNNYYFFNDDDFAWRDDDQNRNARYGVRSIGTSRLGDRNVTRSGIRGVQNGSSVGSAGSTGSTTRVRGGSTGTTRSTGSVGRTRSGGSSRSGSGSSSGNTRRRGGNDQGISAERMERDENAGRSADSGVIRYRTLPTSSSSSDIVTNPTFGTEGTGERAGISQRVRPIYLSGSDFTWDTRTFQDQMRQQRQVTPPDDIPYTTRERSGGFLERLGKFFESSRSSYEHFWDNRGSRGSDHGSVGRDRGGDRTRGSVGSSSRSSSGSDGRSRSGSSSRSRGSGGGDDGGSRSRGGN